VIEAIEIGNRLGPRVSLSFALHFQPVRAVTLKAREIFAHGPKFLVRLTDVVL
jgi:hypothetical protein